MTRLLIFAGMLALVVAAIISIGVLRQPDVEPPVIVRDTAVPTDTPVPTPTLTETPAPQPTVAPVSELAPVVSPVHVHGPSQAAPSASQSVVGGNFAALGLPSNTRTVTGGCASDGTCYPYNFYWAPTHEVVLADYGENNDNQETHEYCHAHQHWTINGGAALVPSDYDLGSWYGTAEARSFTAAVAGLAFPWQLSAASGLEDFAWTCTNWYGNPQRLLDVGGAERYEWAKRNLP